MKRIGNTGNFSISTSEKVDDNTVVALDKRSVTSGKTP